MKQLFLKGAILAIMFSCFSCREDEMESLGDTLLGAEKISVNSTKDSYILSNTILDQKSDLSQISTALLGTLNDELFGKMQSGFAFQVRLSRSVSFRKPQIDSVKLFLAYQNCYGKDTIIKQKANIFLLKTPLIYSEKYNQTSDIESFLGDKVGSISFNKKMASDTIFLKSKVDETKDSLINDKKQYKLLNHLSIKLDNQKVGEYIFKAPKGTFESTANFLEYFKGLCLRTEATKGDGAIYGFNMYQSALMLYYKDQVTLSSGKDSLVNMVEQFPITDNSARFNFPKFEHKKEIFSSQDKIFLQGLHGTKAKLELPDLKNWKDSTRVSINKAELVFTVAQSDDQIKDYSLPESLELKVIKKKENARLVKFMGILNPKKKTYTFQISEFLQSIIEGNDFEYFEVGVGGIEQRLVAGSGGKQEQVLYPIDAKNIASRVVLFKSGVNKPQLKVTYTKY